MADSRNQKVSKDKTVCWYLDQLFQFTFLYLITEYIGINAFTVLKWQFELKINEIEIYV